MSVARKIAVPKVIRKHENDVRSLVVGCYRGGDRGRRENHEQANSNGASGLWHFRL